MERSKGALCLKLFLKFLKIGAFTFGGGYAMIPLIRREIALREGWIEDKDILDILAVSESTPGPIAVNTATFVGYRVAGPLGAACATVGVVLPSFVIIFALSFVLRQFEDFPAVRYAFWGIRGGGGGLGAQRFGVHGKGVPLEHRLLPFGGGGLCAGGAAGGQLHCGAHRLRPGWPGRLQAEDWGDEAVIYLKLFLIFFKIGAFTFGGGYAMLPLIQQEVLSQGWMDLEQLVNFIAVSESTPGPLAVNLSTYIGAETGGLLGSFCATVGVVLPSFVIILLVAKFYQAFQTNTLVKGCMNGPAPHGGGDDRRLSAQRGGLRLPRGGAGSCSGCWRRCCWRPSWWPIGRRSTPYC